MRHSRVEAAPDRGRGSVPAGFHGVGYTRHALCKEQLTVPATNGLPWVRRLRLSRLVALALLVHAAAPGQAATATTAPVRRAPVTLELELAGRQTQVDVSAPVPATGKPRDAVILAHGFTRSRETMAGHAAAISLGGLWAVAPDLPYAVDSRDNARALRDLIAALRGGAAGVPLERFVLVGFSAGGLAAILAANSPGVVGYVGLDPFDRPGGVGREAARHLQNPVWLLRGPSSRCNAYAIAEPWVEALPNLVVDRVLPEASHCDFEDPTDRLCEFVCGRVDPARQAAVQAFLLDAVHGAMASPRQ
jgi:pimeloyl-ACP methyl ester carboxylesterase